jgi:uroporphyrin-III C-methyltransferase
MRWVAQISEYWPISKLASMTRVEMQQILAGENLSTASGQKPSEHLSSRHFGQFPKPGRILLAGSGPGDPSLLTVATHTALTQEVDVVLSDKLVPDAVLALIPKHVHVRIARKFPGNADGAQIEMMEAAVEAAKKGLTVIRVC